MTEMWNPPPAEANPKKPRRRRGVIAGATLLGAGVVAGTILGTAALSSAATPSTTGSTSTAGSTSASTSTTTPPASSSTGQSKPAMPPMGGQPGGGLNLSGTVTAVGTSTVTIKTSSGTTTYQVDSNSDIDKNGEATLKDLVVGDAVRFSVDSSKKTTIDKLHAGNESLDRPKGAPAGAPAGHAPGNAPAGAPSGAPSGQAPASA